MTFGSRRTSSGVPSRDLLAVVQDHDAVADAHDHPHVVLDEQDVRPELRAEPADERGHLRRSRSGSCRPSARRAAAAPGRCPSARASSSRRWSPYGRFLASSSSRPRSPTSRSSSAARSAAASSSRRWRRRRDQVVDQVGLQLEVHADEDVLERRHVLEQADVLERAARCPAATTSLGRALRKMPSRARSVVVPGRPDDRQRRASMTSSADDADDGR